MVIIPCPLLAVSRRTPQAASDPKRSLLKGNPGADSLEVRRTNPNTARTTRRVHDLAALTAVPA